MNATARVLPAPREGIAAACPTSMAAPAGARYLAPSIAYDLPREFMTAWDRSPRGPLDPWCARLLSRLARMEEAKTQGPIDLVAVADCYREAQSIALLLGRSKEAAEISLEIITRLTSSSPQIASLALWAAMGLGRALRAEGFVDDALELFERLAALPMGGTLEIGPLLVTKPLVDSIRGFAPGLFSRLQAVAIMEAMETLITAGRYDIALALAKTRLAEAPTFFDAFRHEALTTSLGALGLLEEALVFLSSAIAREPLRTRPVFEQKRAEVLFASGQIEEARGCSLLVAESLLSRWETGPSTLDDLVLASRVCRLLSRLGHETSSKLAARARPFARLLGDIPLEAEFALRVVENDGPREDHQSALLSLSRITVESGHPLVVLPGVTLGRCPSFLALRERLTLLPT